MQELRIVLDEKGLPEKFRLVADSGDGRRKAFELSERVRQALLPEVLDELFDGSKIVKKNPLPKQRRGLANNA